MPGALALPALAALLQAASAGADFGVRLEGRSTTLSTTTTTSAAQPGPSSVTETRGAYSVTPMAQLRAEAMPLELTGNYQPQLWVSDVKKQRDPLQMHRADLTLRLSPNERWAVAAGANGSRGQTDPLAAFRPGASTSVLQTTGYSVENLRTSLHGEYGWDERTRISSDGSWQISRAVSVANRTLLPTQRSLVLDTAGSWGVTERDTARLVLRGQRVQTGGALRYGGTTANGTPVLEMGTDRYTGLAGAVVAWNHRFTPAFDARAGAGADVAWNRGLQERPDILPNGQLGVTWLFDALTVDVSARLTTLADRYQGTMRSSIEGVGSLNWQLTERWSTSASAFTSHRTNGDTTIVGGEAHLAWAYRTMTIVDLGVRARRQRERDPTLPTYTEGAVFAAVVFHTEQFLEAQGGP